MVHEASLLQLISWLLARLLATYWLKWGNRVHGGWFMV